MNENLLVRCYDVGFGDCVFIRIPDKESYYHVLIDCGSSGPAEPKLKEALNDIRKTLKNDDGSMKPLDLLVISHPHADHIKGFNPAWFKDIKIRHIWLSVFMKKNHPQAKNAQALQKLAENAAVSFLNSMQNRGVQLRPEVKNLLMNSICNTGALEALTTTLPNKNEIKPLYVCRDAADPNRTGMSQEALKEHSVSYEDGTTVLREFKEQGTCLRVLAPEWDIDGYYLGKELCDYTGLLGLYAQGHALKDAGVGKKTMKKPYNISKRDFLTLRKRVLYSALAFAQDDSHLKNNTSVILLLEWRGRRLLFTGDAEWDGRKVEKGHRNGSWDVMLGKTENQNHITKPLDFLKIAHHGSINGTPYVEDAEKQTVLDIILPKDGEAQAVVSTLCDVHGTKYKVPYLPLMKELADRITNSEKHPTEHIDVFQPPRTDCGKKCIDVWIKPNTVF